jgi:uncharacterized protein (TIGR03067 family)
MRMFALLAAGLLISPLLAAPVPKGKKDAEALQGKWQIIRIDLGPDTPADLNKDVGTGYFIFGEDKKLTVRLPREKEDREGEYALDPAASPKAIDVTMKGEDKKRLGLYELDGDTLRLCAPSSPGNQRSEKIEPDGRRYVAVFTFKRVADEKKDR